MSRNLLVGSQQHGEHRWPVILRDTGTWSLSGGMAVCSYTELESLAMQKSANISCPRIVGEQTRAAGLGPKPLFAEDDVATIVNGQGFFNTDTPAR